MQMVEVCRLSCQHVVVEQEKDSQTANLRTFAAFNVNKLKPLAISDTSNLAKPLHERKKTRSASILQLAKNLQVAMRSTSACLATA
jgi:hypothetical protein